MAKVASAWQACRNNGWMFSQGHKPLYTNEMQAEYNVTDLSNGFTVLTESQTFPGSVHMGKSPSVVGQCVRERSGVSSSFY